MKLLRLLFIVGLMCGCVLASTTASVSPTFIDFGFVPVGQTSPPVTVTVTNTGSSTLTWLNPGSGISQVSGPSFNFATPNGTCIIDLAPGASCTTKIVFQPSNTTPQTGSFRIANDATNSPFTVNVIGTGTLAPPSLAGLGCVGTCNVIGSVTFGGVAGPSVTSITVLPASVTSPLNQPVTFTALATFSDSTTADVTNQATWFLSPLGVASNAANVATCTAGGTVTVSAELVGVIGTASLVCQSYQIVPRGDLTAFLNTPYAQQFTELGGVGPYTWSAGGGSLPNGLSFTAGGLLSGTPSQLGNFTFTVSNVDSSGPPFTDHASVTVHVLAQQTEDNIYCDAGENVVGLFADGPAQPLQNCNNTAVANTPTLASGAGYLATNVRFVCPVNESLDPAGSLFITGCGFAGQATFEKFFNSFQIAMSGCSPNTTPCPFNITATVAPAPCGTWIRYFPANYYPSAPVLTQNVYNESLVIPPTACTWASGGIWVSPITQADVNQFGFSGFIYNYDHLPAPGARITPAWAGQGSLPGRPTYAQPAAAGIYVGLIKCVPQNANTCQPLTTPPSSGDASAWRFIGIEFTQPHGREATCPLNFNGTPQCSPGFTSSLLSLGCTGADAGGNNCGVTGVNHIILDRVILHACTDKTDIDCKEQARQGLELQGGRHLSLIDSYLYGFKTMVGVGPSVEAHGISGGNVKNSGDDLAFKIVNNHMEGSSCDFFWGGGASTTGVYSYDIEFRRNELWKPLLWKVDDPTFTQMGGKVFDAWVGATGATYANDPGTSCTIDPPTGANPIQATCTAHVAGGKVLDVTITNQGNGYVQNPKITFSGGNGNAKAFPMIGVYNVKNHFELKNGRRVLVEGVRFAQVWKGQSDQDAFAVLMTPKNNGTCLTCTVQDVTFRYSLSQGSNRGMQLGTEAATRCGVSQTSVITSISEVGNVVTVIVTDAIIPQVTVGATVDISGVPVGGYNGAGFVVTSVNNATKTFTYTNPTSGLGSSSGGTAAFTPTVCLPDVAARISVHDFLVDGVNPVLWISKAGAFDGFGGGCFTLQNANPQAIALQDVSFNHVGCITTSPVGSRASTLAAGLTLGYNCVQNSPLYAGIVLRNSYVAGGVKAEGQVSHGCYACDDGTCSGGSQTALNSLAVSDKLLPVGGGLYTKGQVLAGVVDGGGTCTAGLAPTSCSFVGGGGSGAVCTFRTDKTKSVVTSVAPSDVGSGYTSAPSVSFSGGTCSVPPTAHTVIAGIGIASSKSYCMNNNVMATAAYIGETPMTPYPTTQGDPTNNTCARHAGGGNLSVANWPAMLFTNFPVDAAGNEIPTGDLHLLPGSSGHNAGDDGLDVGPNIDLINQYTGCQISGGVEVCQ